MSERAAGPSVRVKLTLSYAAFVVLVGASVFALGFLVLRFVPDGNLFSDSGDFTPARRDLVEAFVRYAWYTVLGLALIGLAGGWVVAGVMLRPLARITGTAGAVRDGELSARTALPGRRDELTDLADTFDAMLTRVESTVREQQRFAANAAHELRTPQATMRTLLEVARADPTGVDVDVLLERLTQTNERAIRLTAALLALARTAREDALDREEIDLVELVGAVMADSRDEADAADVRLHLSPSPLPVGASVDETLVVQAVRNLVHNAIVHNVRGGEVHLVVEGHDRDAVIEVANTGVVLGPDDVATLTEPFVRGAGRTRGAHDGLGLGLAIVVSVARAHRGHLALGPRDGGGLRVRLRLPRH